MAHDREVVYSERVRAGRRTYFFDVCSTRGKDLYLMLTESKKHTKPDGSVRYEKHRIILYKEDFNNFVDALTASIAHVDKTLDGAEVPKREEAEPPSTEAQDKGTSDTDRFTDIDFEDLDGN